MNKSYGRSGGQGQQFDFSGGEIGPRMIMREDDALHHKSLLSMVNFAPTLQGSAARCPGTKFIMELPGSPPTARILPYIQPNGARTLVYMTPRVGATWGNLNVLQNVQGAANAPTTSLSYDFITENGSLNAGTDNWTLSPPGQYVSPAGNPLGWIVNEGYYTLKMQRGHHISSSSPNNGYISGPITIPEATDHVILCPQFFYLSNPGTDYGITVTIKLGTTLNGSDLFSLVIDPELRVGGPAYAIKTVVPGTFTAGQVVYLTVNCGADAGPGNDGDAVTKPNFVVTDMQVMSLVTQDIGDTLLTAVIPYHEYEINDVHFIQSPYTAVDIVGGVGKEMVMTHSNDPPMRLYFDGVDYQFDIIFTDNATQFHDQWAWDTNGYPSTCTSYNGRLILAGSSDDGAVASPNGSNCETVWGTVVGDWSKFTDPGIDEVLPTDSISFTAIYRSAIKWITGQRQLLIGADEFEYAASADGIFSPQDLGVTMQSTHGSNRVQPVPMGGFIFFAAEGGTKLRSMMFQSEEDGWVSPDMTLAHPTLLSAGIVRMVRMRNPHQMCVVLLKSGQLALFHVDTHAGLYGWSRYALSGKIIDIAVVSDKTGADVLYLLIKRTSNGVTKLYIEAVPNWTERDSRKAAFLESSISAIASAPTNVLDGLDHLNGRSVQVMADGNYHGSYTVVDGSITLVNQLDEPINYTSIIAGLPMSCTMSTLPIIGSSPDAKKRYSNITVRAIGSSRPIINGERNADREPLAPLNQSQRADIIYDNTIANSGSDLAQIVTIQETLPFNVEVLGIFGNLKESSI